MNKKRVVIVGGGFGGLAAAKKFSRSEFHVTLIDKRNYHLFQPLLYQVATATLNLESIAHPVRAIMRGKRNVQFQMAEVQKVDLAEKKLQTTLGEVPYDYLILGAGSVTNHFGMTSVAAMAPPESVMT